MKFERIYFDTYCNKLNSEFAMSCCSLLYYSLYLIVPLVILKLYVKLTTGLCRSNTCLVGKTAIITGSNIGIGFETALDFAKRGAKLILACRDQKKGEKAKRTIIEETGNPNIHLKLVDLASFKSVVNFAAEINKTEDRLDILVNNAGLEGIFDNTEDGIPTIMQVNYLSHFLLTHLLLNLLKKTENSRIVNVSSIAAAMSSLDVENPNSLENTSKMYGNTKLANILFTRELAKKLSGTSVTTYSLHPGVVATEFIRSLPPFVTYLMKKIIQLFFKDSYEGAQTTIYVSVARNIEDLNGLHFSDCKLVSDYSVVKKNLENTEKLWKASERICGKYLTTKND